MTGQIISIICLLVALPVSMLGLECLIGSIRHKGTGLPGGEAPPFLVLVPAHDEAAIIAPIVAAITSQLRPCDELIVIADNCTDGTAAICRLLGATVFERHEPARRGKGYALEFGRRMLAGHRAEVVIILDADCLPCGDGLQRLASRAARSQAVVQGADLILPDERASALVRISCFAFLVKNLVRQRALAWLSGTALVQGTGMAIPGFLFREVKWPGSSLVEDLVFGLELLIEGHSVQFEPSAQFVSPASSDKGTAEQRNRWEHGMLETIIDYVPRLLVAGLKGRPALLLVALDLLIPPTVLLLLLSATATLAGLALAGPVTAVNVLVGANLVLASGVFLVWLKLGRTILPWASLCQLPRYVIWKLPLLARFLTKRQREWTRTERKT